jgi:hypothetical protein
MKVRSVASASPALLVSWSIVPSKSVSNWKVSMMPSPSRSSSRKSTWPSSLMSYSHSSTPSGDRMAPSIGSRLLDAVGRPDGAVYRIEVGIGDLGGAAGEEGAGDGEQRELEACAGVRLAHGHPDPTAGRGPSDDSAPAGGVTLRLRQGSATSR